MFGRKKGSRCGAVIVAAGSGRRMQLGKSKDGRSVNKVYLEVAGIPVLAHTLMAFEACRSISEIVVVTRECDIPLCKPLADEFGITKLKSVVCGGAERQDSVQNGLLELGSDCIYAAIHDGARCLIRPDDIAQVVAAAQAAGAASLGIACSDSLKRIDASKMAAEDVDRTGVYRIQTPQVFVTEQIIAAHALAREDGFRAADDCSVAQHAGIRVQIVDSGAYNFKITTQDDLALAEMLLVSREY